MLLHLLVLLPDGVGRGEGGGCGGAPAHGLQALLADVGGGGQGGDGPAGKLQGCEYFHLYSRLLKHWLTTN